MAVGPACACILGVLATSPPTRARSLIPLCESGLAGADAYDLNPLLSGHHLGGNDIYLRYAAAELLGSATDSLYDNYFVLGWVSSADPTTGLRTLWVGTVRDFPPQDRCEAGGARRGPFTVDLEGVVDVNWVHHGGHLPAGQVGRVAYGSHGYLVWSGKGDESTAPAVVVGRFWEQNGVLQLEPIRLQRSCSLSACGWSFPTGITPSMASNRPVPWNIEYTSARRGGPVYYNPALVCDLARLLESLGIDAWEHCDYGHRLALVYSGDPRWITERKTNLEYIGCDWSDPSQDCRFWVGSSIRYTIFRPGDNRVLHEGVLADVRNSPDFDPVLDHAIYPEIAWNEAEQKWLVVWEEAQLDRSVDPVGHTSRWKARTLSPDGTLGPVADLGVCWNWSTETSTGPIDPGDETGGGTTGGDDRPPALPIQQNYCYPMNLANDYYSLQGAPWAGDRNQDHLTFFSNYMLEPDGEPHGPYQWIFVRDGKPEYATNLVGADQVYSGEPNLQSVSVIGHPFFRDQTPYDQASYVKVGYVYDPGMGCRNVFYLMTGRPDDAHQEGAAPDQQYYRVDDTAPWDPDCESRYGWATASSMVGLVALWSQWVPTQQRFEMRFGTYYWSAPGY